MEELIRTLQEICIEHFVMRQMLAEENQLPRARQLCRQRHYRDVVQSRFRETLGSNLDNLPDEIGTAHLLAALETTHLGA